MSEPNMPNNALSSIPLIIKIIAVILGAIFALTLTGDIDNEGRIHLSFGVMIKIAFSAFFGFLGGDFAINYFNLQEWSHASHGFIMMVVSVFGMAIVGLVYQCLLLTFKEKSASELAAEIKATFKAIIK